MTESLHETPLLPGVDKEASPTTTAATYDLPNMTVDALLYAIFKEQERLYPDIDPGDLTINVQDDMPMVTVSQDGWVEKPETLYAPTMGHFVHEVLCKYLSGILQGRVVRVDP